MGLELDGNRNRAAGRDFNENNIRAENVIGRDLVNITIPAIEKDTRPLVPAQRKLLHQLVLDIAEASGEEGYAIWQRVHAEIGVKNVEEMAVNHYQPAYSYLQAQLDLCREKSHKKELVASLLKISANNDNYQALLLYCRKNFGSSRLIELQLTDLQRALLWLDEQRQDVIIQQQIVPSGLTWWQIVRRYPAYTGAVFGSGFVVVFLVYFICR